MSKMPAKKKSCFQITSVTQAQVAGLGAADDTESLDDPDESRTEDVSSEIYDMSRAEYDPACDISSSEEALNNVGEPEAISSVMAPSHIPLAVQSSNNPVGEFRKVGVSGSTHGGQQQPPPGIGLGSSQPGAAHQQAGPATGLSVNASQPAAVVSPAPPPATSTVSCTSRFRVIKLDHGTGEPFRRGRWTCTEFYEKDSDGNRTVDSIRHAGGATTLDPAADRDSGLGHTGGGAAPATHSGQGLGSAAADASLAAASRVHSAETQQPQQILHQNYMARPHSGSTTQSSTAGPVQPTVAGSLQPPQSGLLPVGLNGLPQSGVHLQKSPVMPPSAQLIAYPPQQLAVGQHLSGQTHNQTEYYQQPQPSSMQPGFPTGQVLPVGQGPGPAVPLTSGVSSVPSQIGDVAVAALPGPQPAGLVQQQTGGMGGVGGSMLLAGSTLQQQALGPYATAPTGPPQPQGLHLTSSGVQNVPAMAAGSTVPAAVPSASSSGAMPNVSTSSLPNLGQIAHHSMTPVVALGVQGLPAAGFGHVEGGVGRLEGLFNVQSPPVGSGREPLKPLMPESLQLATPTVNSLFGIHIPVDGDVDRASGTNVAAIDNKIEQAMDLVKSHLMYAVREEVEVLKEQIKELYERNSVLERENAVLKSLANSEQLSQLPSQPATTPPQPGQSSQPQIQAPAQPQIQAPAQIQAQAQAQIQTLPKPQQLQTQPQLDPTQQQQQQLQPNVTSA